jgi:hypothetical protein
MRCLRVGVEIVPTTNPDLARHGIIPGSDRSAFSGIIRPARESVTVRHAL